ncbi:hypothetical protein DdX_04573 [Ditylenchus destructor]|uniref:Uncharacterized protein n=1 Tax=Ditylenchus destructor TaxID=166010 RepID=A0AAD4N9V0_9BILA|nr:hypothetical protein DdX_04573 [Ditylenchus destructor]
MDISLAEFLKNIKNSLDNVGDSVSENFGRLGNYSSNVAADTKQWFHDTFSKISHQTAVGQVDHRYSTKFPFQIDTTETTTMFSTTESTTTSTPGSEITASALELQSTLMEYWPYSFISMAIISLLFGFMAGMAFGYLCDQCRIRMLKTRPQPEAKESHGMGNVIQKLDQRNKGDVEYERMA